MFWSSDRGFKPVWQILVGGIFRNIHGGQCTWKMHNDIFPVISLIICGVVDTDVPRSLNSFSPAKSDTYTSDINNIQKCMVHALRHFICLPGMPLTRTPCLQTCLKTKINIL